MPAIVTLPVAKDHLRITDADHDGDVQQKIDAATAAVVTYYGSSADPAWDDTTAPAVVVQAILLYLTHLYEHRGDDLTADPGVWTAIRNLLAATKDPALA